MIRVLNILMVFMIIIFFTSTYKYYSSNENKKIKNFNRSNIDLILKEKINDLPVLINDTSNIIVFNNSLEIKEDNKKKRRFWDLIDK